MSTRPRPEEARTADATTAPGHGPFPHADDPARPVEILRVIAGSHAYGTAHEGSDVDIRGVHVIPTAERLGLGEKDPPGETLKSETGDQLWYEVGKFCRLALVANPAALEVLFVRPEHVIVTTPYGERLRALRRAFLSRRAAETYFEYARGQRGRVKLTGPRATDYDHKAAVHLLRVLQQGIALLRTGELELTVPARLAEEMREIYAGLRPCSVVEARADHLMTVLEGAAATSVLPEQPDRAAVDAFLREVRRAFYDGAPDDAVRRDAA